MQATYPTVSRRPFHTQVPQETIEEEAAMRSSAACIMPAPIIATEATVVAIGAVAAIGIYVTIAIVCLTVVHSFAAFASIEEAFVVACLLLCRALCTRPIRVHFVRGVASIDHAIFGNATAATTFAAGVVTDLGGWAVISGIVARFGVRLVAHIIGGPFLAVETIFEGSLLLGVVLYFAVIYAIGMVRLNHPTLLGDDDIPRSIDAKGDIEMTPTR